MTPRGEFHLICSIPLRFNANIFAGSIMKKFFLSLQTFFPTPRRFRPLRGSPAEMKIPEKKKPPLSLSLSLASLLLLWHGILPITAGGGLLAPLCARVREAEVALTAEEMYSGQKAW